MDNIWMKLTFIGTGMGLIILIKSLVEIIKIQKQIHKIKDDEILPEDIRAKILKNLGLSIIGIFLTSLSGLIRIFLR